MKVAASDEIEGSGCLVSTVSYSQASTWSFCVRVAILTEVVGWFHSIFNKIFGWYLKIDDSCLSKSCKLLRT
jgi:hypothetical protein